MQASLWAAPELNGVRAEMFASIEEKLPEMMQPAVYLPERSATLVSALAAMVKAGRAEPLQNFMSGSQEQFPAWFQDYHSPRHGLALIFATIGDEHFATEPLPDLDLSTSEDGEVSLAPEAGTPLPKPEDPRERPPPVQLWPPLGHHEKEDVLAERNPEVTAAATQLWEQLTAPSPNKCGAACILVRHCTSREPEHLQCAMLRWHACSAIESACPSSRTVMQPVIFCTRSACAPKLTAWSGAVQ